MIGYINYIMIREDESLLELKDQLKRFSSSLEFIKVIGRGAFGTVIQAKYLKSNEDCAVKMLNKTISSNDYNLLRSESAILASLHHENIVKFKEVLETDTRILIVMELVRGGSLLRIMKQRQKTDWFTEDECKTILRHIFLSLEYIHSQNIVHRDLKPENILIQDPNDLSTLRISDFGLSTNYLSTLSGQCGTTVYMAPELLDGKIYSKAVDIWSAGIIMYMLLNHGKHPYYESGDSEQTIRHKINKIHQNVGTMTNKQFSLYTKLVTHEPHLRYTAFQCKYHPWLSDWDYSEIPQTMEEMFKGWRTAQVMLKYMKFLMLIISITDKTELDELYIQKCSHLSTQNELIVKEIHMRQGRVNGIDKEFYDKLFQQYQEQIEEIKRMNENNPYLIKLQQEQTVTKNNELREKFNELMKRKLITLHHVNETQECQSANFQVEQQQEEVFQEGEEDEMEAQEFQEGKKNESVTTAQVCLPRKKMRARKPQKQNISKNKLESCYAKVKQLNSNSQSPGKQMLQANVITQGNSNNVFPYKQNFKIQLKPLYKDELLKGQNQKPEIETNFMFNVPRKAINRSPRKSSNQTEQVIPQQQLLEVALSSINMAAANQLRALPYRRRNMSVCYPTSVYSYPIVSSFNQDFDKKCYMPCQDTERFQSFINKLKQQIK